MDSSAHQWGEAPPALEVMIQVHLPFQHVLQVGQPRFPRGDDVDGIGAEGAVDKPPGMQVAQGLGDLEQQVHDLLHVQQGELGALQAGDKLPGTQGLGPLCFLASKVFSIDRHNYSALPCFRWRT